MRRIAPIWFDVGFWNVMVQPSLNAGLDMYGLIDIASFVALVAFVGVVFVLTRRMGLLAASLTCVQAAALLVLPLLVEVFLFIPYYMGSSIMFFAPRWMTNALALEVCLALVLLTPLRRYLR